MSKKILSLTDKVWEIADETISFENLNELIRVILKNRGIEDVEAFKCLSLRNSMPDPFVFVDMEKAVARIVAAIIAGEKIAILGDYDVDGISSTVLFMNFFEYLKVPFTYSIPNRMEEGYGLSVENLKKHKNHLVVAVDCGSSSFDELKYAQKEKIDVVVIDHHKMESIPEAIAIVNPHRPDESVNFKDLCAAAMVFMCIVGINRELRNKGFYKDKDLKEPNLLEYLDLVALATICDVMPLVGIDRAFVINGIKTMRRRKNFGIDALISQNKTSDVTSDTIAFSFGPKINAAGRLASADLSVQLLSTKNPIEAKKIAQQLDDFNKERQALERKIIKEAIQQIDEDANFICAYSKKWHVGIVGIVAGRLKETYHKPSLVIAIDENGQGRGSCRSIPQVDISVIINKAIQKGIVASGGGHSMAAGFCIEEDKIPAFIEFLQNEITYEKSCEELNADCYLAADIAISLETTKGISAIGPFGNGNKHPKFVIPNLMIAQTRIVGKNHIRLRLSDVKKGVSLDAISFRSAGTTLGNILLNHKDPIQVLGTLSVSEWNGKKSICFILEDVAKG